jgi:type VI secretion system protein ImpF
MAPQKHDRLAPPLMHAFRAAHEKRDARERVDLRDEGGDRVIAQRRANSRMPITESGLRREVAIDLANLLNTTNLAAAEPLAGLDAVKSSVLNFGFPDLSHRSIDEHGLAALPREIETAIVDFEPRLARGSIRVRRDDTVAASDLKLRFVVKAELRVDPIDTPVEFAAELELDTGKIRIDRLAR